MSGGAGPRGSMKSADNGGEMRHLSSAYGGPSVFNRNGGNKLNLIQSATPADMFGFSMAVNK